MRGHRVGLLTGDLEYAAANANMYASNKLWSGASLQEVEKDTVQITSWLKAQKQDSALTLAVPCLHLIHTLTGKNGDPFNIDFLDSTLKHANETKNATVLAIVCKQKLMIGYLFGDYEFASTGFMEFQMGTPAPYSKTIMMTFKALSAMALARQGIKKSKNLRMAKSIIMHYRTMTASYGRHFRHCDRRDSGDGIQSIGQETRALDVE
jgi:hypothetical protein